MYGCTDLGFEWCVVGQLSGGSWAFGRWIVRWNLALPNSFYSNHQLLTTYHQDTTNHQHLLLRKEVIQPHLPIRLPCYDFTPITNPTFDGSLLSVKSPASGVARFRGVTGGVYKARERIHRSMLTCDY